MKSVWQAVAESLGSIEAQLPKVWPPELPPEFTPNFWFLAVQQEMRTRSELSAAIRELLTGKEVPDMTPLQGWLFRRRIEWAGQFTLAAVQRGLEPTEPLLEVLEHVLVRTWEASGCVGMWYHAERDGKPHPENIDGRSPLGPLG